jgi:hypothetical protein
MVQRTRAVLVFLVTLFAIGACGEDDDARNDNAPHAGTGGQAGLAGSGGNAGSGTDATGGSGGSGGSAGSDGTSGGTSDAGSDAPAGTPRPLLPADKAPDFSALKYLEKAGPVTAPVADGWNPTAGIGDVASFTPTYTVAATGGTHTTVQAAVDAAAGDGGTGRVSRLTTRSNTYQVHVRAQTIRKARSVGPEKFDATKDSVTSEYRGSAVLERYIDLTDLRLKSLDFATAAPGTKTLDSYHRIRVLNQKRFDP